ncbi:uncharacterized protein LOC144158915 [Haemaphysalis longicornis]
MAPAATDSVYTLTGFGQFLEWRRVRFAEPLPKIRICQVCGVVAAVAKLLPCTHVLCETCEDRAEEKGRKCPVDGYCFQGEDVQDMPFSRRDIDERVVHCLNHTGDDTGCRFSGKLGELERHFFVQCRHGIVQCSKCKAQVTRQEVFDHYTYCEGEKYLSLENVADGNTVTFDAMEAVRLASSLRDIRDGINDAINAGSNSSMKMGELKGKVISLSSFIRILDPAGGSVEDEGYLSAQTCEDDIGPTGSILCTFEGIDTTHPVVWLENPCMLDGYTFKLALKFETKCGKLPNVFVFFVLSAGEKDDFVEWPFKKQVRMSLVHPNDADKKMALPFKITSKTDAKCLKKPDEDQKGIYSDKISWKNILKSGFVFHDSVTVKVSFE